MHNTANAEKISLTAEDGFPLSALLFQATSKARANLLLNPATGVKKEYYAKLAEYLSEEGYRVLILDYRGIGESMPRSQEPKSSNSKTLKGFEARMGDWGIQDLSAAADYFLTQYPNDKLLAIGHSVGGQMMGFIQPYGCLHGAIHLNVASGYWGWLKFPYNLGTWLIWNIVLPLLHAFYGYSPMKHYGFSENLPLGVAKDWSRWCQNKDYFQELLEEKLGAKTFKNFKAPLISYYPSDDYVANDTTVARILEFYKHAPTQRKKIAPEDQGLKTIGHFGFFRKGVREWFWPQLKVDLDKLLSKAY